MDAIVAGAAQPGKVGFDVVAAAAPKNPVVGLKSGVVALLARLAHVLEAEAFELVHVDHAPAGARVSQVFSRNSGSE